MAVALADNRESVPLHGVRVHRLTMDGALRAIDGFIKARVPHHVVTLDSSMCVMAASDPELRGIIACAELVTPDSAGVLWACARQGQTLPERVSGVEIVEQLCALSPLRGYRLYFLGAAPGVAERAAEQMRARYPGCHVVGARNGYFGPDDEPDIVREIRDAHADVLCVALGIPKQEKWIARHRDALGTPVLIGVGGTFDVHSGLVKRAPEWMRRHNLEWLYRFYRNPRKVSKILCLPRFVLMTLHLPHHRTQT